MLKENYIIFIRQTKFLSSPTLPNSLIHFYDTYFYEIFVLKIICNDSILFINSIDEFVDVISTITATSGNDRLLFCGDV